MTALAKFRSASEMPAGSVKASADMELNHVNALVERIKAAGYGDLFASMEYDYSHFEGVNGEFTEVAHCISPPCDNGLRMWGEYRHCLATEQWWPKRLRIYQEDHNEDEQCGIMEWHFTDEGILIEDDDIRSLVHVIDDDGHVFFTRKFWAYDVALESGCAYDNGAMNAVIERLAKLCFSWHRRKVPCCAMNGTQEEWDRERTLDEIEEYFRSRYLSDDEMTILSLSRQYGPTPSLLSKQAAEIYGWICTTEPLERYLTWQELGEKLYRYAHKTGLISVNGGRTYYTVTNLTECCPEWKEPYNWDRIVGRMAPDVLCRMDSNQRTAEDILQQYLGEAEFGITVQL